MSLHEQGVAALAAAMSAEAWPEERVQSSLELARWILDTDKGVFVTRATLEDAWADHWTRAPVDHICGPRCALALVAAHQPVAPDEDADAS